MIAALIDVRPDEASARFDDELADALSHHRIDAETARALRWWQRTSVHAAESYAATVVPGVFAARDEADEHARAEAAHAAAAWRAALEASGCRGAPASGLHDGRRPMLRLTAPITELAPRQLAPVLAVRASRASVERTRRAVRAAFAAAGDPADAVPHPADASPIPANEAHAAGEMRFDVGSDANGGVAASANADGDLRSHRLTIDLTATTVTNRPPEHDSRKDPPDHADPASPA